MTTSQDVSYTRRRLLVIGALSLPPFGWWWRRTTSAPPRSAASPPSQPSPTSAAPPPTAAGAVPAPTTSPPTAALEHALRHGLAEPKVARLQEQLRSLRFDSGPVDGVFGDATVRAVWAFEKLVLGVPRHRVTGVVDAEIWDRMLSAQPPAPRRTASGNHVEVYLPEQVAVVFRAGEPLVVTHVSTGAGDEWCDEVTIDNDNGTTTTKGICGRAITPGGVYHVERKLDGWRNAPLGRLYKPIYFNYGIAIHGASKVPNEPASRGCVRVPMHIAEYLPSMLDVGDDVYVFDGVEEPEHYGAQLPVFDWPDPNYTTTTTTTTSSPASAPTDSSAAGPASRP